MKTVLDEVQLDVHSVTVHDLQLLLLNIGCSAYDTLNYLGTLVT